MGEGLEKKPIVTLDYVCKVINREYLRCGSINKTEKKLLGLEVGIVSQDLYALLRVGTQDMSLRQGLDREEPGLSAPENKSPPKQTKQILTLVQKFVMEDSRR